MKTIVDLFNILHVAFNVAKTNAIKEKGDFTEDDVGLYYHKVLDSIINLTKNHGKLILANEGVGSLEWRRSIYPEYKANRKKDDTYQIFKNHLKDVEKLLSYFPTKNISVPGAEADDVMYALATYFVDSDENEEVLIITGDRDIAQLINYSDRIKVYSPTLGIYRDKQPNILLEKAIVGDPSDNIPGIPRIGIKTFEKALADKNVWETKIAPNFQIVENFLKIVDLSKAPSHLKDEAIIKFNSSDYNEFDPQSIEQFMFDNALREHINRWPNNIADINMSLYTHNMVEVDRKVVEETALDDVDEILNMINNL